MKKVFSLVLTLLLCFSFSVPASASMISTAVAQPYYEKANEVESKLTINGTTATCKSMIYGCSNVVSITVDQYLEKQGFLWSWSTYDDTEWTETISSNSATVVQHQNRTVRRHISFKDGIYVD